jgi:hypothetical protein
LTLFETKGNPTLKTLLAVIKSVRMRLSVEPENLVHAQAKSVAGQDPKPNLGLLILQHCADVGRDNVAAADGYDGTLCQ